MAPAFTVLRMPPVAALPSPPGAAISTLVPKLLYDARLPVGPVAATVITPVQLAGLKPEASALLLPAATTTVAPTATTSLMANCSADRQARLPPRLMLSTLAGFGLVGTPVTARPAAQRMPSTMSLV